MKANAGIVVFESLLHETMDRLTEVLVYCDINEVTIDQFFSKAIDAELKTSFEERRVIEEKYKKHKWMPVQPAFLQNIKVPETTKKVRRFFGMISGDSIRATRAMIAAVMKSHIYSAQAILYNLQSYGVIEVEKTSPKGPLDIKITKLGQHFITGFDNDAQNITISDMFKQLYPTEFAMRAFWAARELTVIEPLPVTD